MASIIDAFNEAFSEDKALLKIILYSIPVNVVLSFFAVGKTSLFIFWGCLTIALVLGLLTQGIYNVRQNKREILTLNPLALLKAILKTAVVVLPHLIVFGWIAYFIVESVSIPVEWPYIPLTFKIVVWSIAFSIVLTSYLSFAKNMSLIQGFNYAVISESCIDILVSFIFFVPQLLLANAMLIGPVVYLYYYIFRLPFDHWGFILCVSLVCIVNVSMLANYFAQAAYEQIKGNNEDYDDKFESEIVIEDPEKFLKEKK